MTELRSTLPANGEFVFEGPVGRLEAVLKRAPSTKVAAVVCHPHPQFGGTLYDKVVFRAARALHSSGITVLRFNFRGVEGSEGSFDEGRGEVDDARAALDLLAAEHEALIVAGYSFGSWVGLRAGADDPRVRALIGVGLPANAVDLSFLRATDKPTLLIQGDRDSWGAIDRVRALAEGRAELCVLHGADHALDGYLEPMMATISSFVARLGLPASPPAAVG